MIAHFYTAFSISSNATAQAPTTGVMTDVSLASSVILTVMSSVLFSSASAVLFLYYWRRLGRALVETRIGLVIFFLGALLTAITTLGCYKRDKVYGVYTLFIEISIGIILMIAGVVSLFERQSPEREIDDYGRPLIPVGHTHGSTGIVIWVITIPLSALEMLFAIGAATKAPAPVYATVEFVSLTQKLVQASIYYFSLRHKVPSPLMRMGCSWFLKTISLLNFAMWIDSIVTTHTDNAFAMELFGKGFSIVKSAYNALLIDYRLLCSLLFLEHVFELEDTRDNSIEAPYDLFDEPRPDRETMNSTSVNVEVVHYSGYGYMIGLICVGLQLVNGLQYLDFVGDWSNIFPILADFAVILFGLLLLGGSSPIENNHRKWRETESKAIDIMVGFMGAVGFVFWLMKSSFCFLWTFSTMSKPADKATKSYLAWTSVKDLVRAIGMLFQLHFFVKMGPHYSRNIGRRMYHLLVPAIMLALLSIFVACVIDQYNGRVEHLINQSHLDPSITSFFEAAAPIHLGFSLHMFLHFYIIKRKMSSLQYVHPRRDVHFSQVTESYGSNESGNGMNERDERESHIYSNT
ncbi:uncharacterized protein LOC116305900 [Actinia tenebrosa]|uniref:Uncharacterized protein LOC116305900 n=1 Tax=Actinia tenebrosa TaxID=6105 RepID=A0A6P8J0T8_ACTTE|nr:uncharacterized protein LOC116305900 [Actinia tenebrosa]